VSYTIISTTVMYNTVHPLICIHTLPLAFTLACILALISTGLFCGTFYHFFVNDTKGPIGNFLRNHIPYKKLFDMDEKTFAMCFVSFFMQVMGILQIPSILGPSFTPFQGFAIRSPWKDPTTWKVGKVDNQKQGKSKGVSEKSKSIDNSKTNIAAKVKNVGNAAASAIQGAAKPTQAKAKATSANNSADKGNNNNKKGTSNSNNNNVADQEAASDKPKRKRKKKNKAKTE
jgi:hypothetical protein